MSLASTIRSRADELVAEWVEYAARHVEAARHLPTEELEDSARGLFSAIADDMESSQTPKEQRDKSHGNKKHDSLIVRHAEHHAEHRLCQGFTANDLVAEFRAARASVMRLWSEGKAGKYSAVDIIRFNEAIDEAVSVSLGKFEAQLGLSRDLFLGVLGHDMRNPLGAVMLSARVLLKDDALSPSAAKAATRVYSSGTRLTQMLNDLLDLTRTRLGKGLPVTLVDGDMGEAIGTVVDELRAYHPSAAIEYRTSGDIRGRWDFARLAQVVSNLGGNAIQHGDTSHPITIQLTGREDTVELAVSNTGKPIPKQALARIFDPMTRGSESQERGSIGLGLYISRQVALAHQGKISVKSDDAGTAFTVCIPRHIDRRRS